MARSLNPFRLWQRQPRDPAKEGCPASDPTINELEASTPDPAQALKLQDFIWAVGSLAQLHRLPFDPKLLLQRFPPPYTLSTIREALKEMGLTVQEKFCFDAKPLPRTDFPCLALVKPKPGGDIDPPQPSDPVAEVSQPDRPDARESGARVLQLHPGKPDEPTPPPSFTPALLLSGDETRILYFRAGSKAPETTTWAEFDQTFEPEVYAVLGPQGATRASGDDSDLAKPDQVKFGFRWFIPELLKHKRIWRDVLLASLVIQLIGLATPLFTQVIIDKVVVHQTMSTLTVVGIGMAIFLIFNAMMTFLRQYMVIHTGNRVDAVLGSQVFRHLLRLPMLYFNHRPTGIITARLQGVETIREFVTGAAVSLVLDLPFMSIFLVVMFFYSWQLTLIALGILLCITILSILVTPRFRERLNHQFLLGARNQAYVTEYVSGMETVKSLQMEPLVEKRYGENLSSYLSAGFATRKLANSYNTIANALEQVLTLSVLIVGALLVMRNDGFTIGMLVAFQMFAGRLSQPMLRLVGLYQEFQQANIAVKRLGDLMDCPAEPYSLTPSRRTERGGKIEIKDLSFRYSKEHPYLYRDFSLVLPEGKAMGLMGPSGCGKSTLAKLLLGFVWPTDGRISIDGVDIRHLSANELRSFFGVVPQETILFSGTIYDNLSSANPHASFDDVVAACRMAEIHTVIEGLPKGYQTEIGERGVGLSGGQKQRLAIARALIKKPRILIFDEATANLDAPTAESFATTVNGLKGKVTMLFITHHLPKGLVVDGVVRLGGGKAPEGGK